MRTNNDLLIGGTTILKTLYLVRHGETLFNQLHKVQGWCDSPLTKLGVSQAQRVGLYFRDQQIYFSSVYCSTAERTADTLEQITNLPYHRIKGLREWNFGVFEGEPEYLNPALPYGDFYEQYGGESEQNVQTRIVKTITEIALKESSQPILIVSHGAALRQFVDYWQNTTKVRLSSGIPNGCIMKFIFDESNSFFKLEKVIDPSHL